MSVKRASRISNDVLCKIAFDYNWQHLFFARHFQPKEWEPYTLNYPQEVLTSRKKVADFVEALIGACYVDGGTMAALKFLSDWLKVVNVNILDLPYDEHSRDSLVDDRTASSPPIQSSAVQEEPQSEKFIVAATPLEALIGYRFNNQDIAKEAFLHSSKSKTKNYQRLEFLGDSILDWLVSRFLFNSNPTSTPGDLSILRQSIVSNESLGLISLNLELYQFLSHESPTIDADISDFKGFLERKEQSFALQCPKVCTGSLTLKVLGDLFEALVGAVFVDSGCNILTTWNVVKPLILDSVEHYVDPLTVAKSPIRLFIEIVQDIRKTTDAIRFEYVS